jgi:hypothetical protein
VPVDFGVSYPNCVNHQNFIISGGVLNPDVSPVHVWEVTGSFYNDDRGSPFTRHTFLARPLIAPEVLRRSH